MPRGYCVPLAGLGTRFVKSCRTLEPRTAESVSGQRSRRLVIPPKRRCNKIPLTSSRIPATRSHREESGMAKGPTMDFAEQHAKRTVHAVKYEMDWMREIAEQSLNHIRRISRDSRTTAEIIERQACEVRERSISLAAETSILRTKSSARENRRNWSSFTASSGAGICRTKQGAGAKHRARSD